MKKEFFVLIMLLTIFNLSAPCDDEIGRVELKSNELLILSKQALAGNIIADIRMSNHYTVGKYDYDKMIVWTEIGFENGSGVAAHNLAFYLAESKDKKKYIRSIYLSFCAAQSKHRGAIFRIKDENLKLESSYPTLGEDIYKKENDKISDHEIEVLIDYALRGGKKEAYRLYEYYQDYKKDEAEAVYWLRIGAQNKNLDCRYEYGKYLLGKDDEYSKIRGGFWIKKAAQNGNAKAKELVKKLKESKNSLALLAYDEDFDLPNEELIELTKKGLAGNIEAGVRVYNYYTYVSFDRAKTEQWNEFLAESGEGVNQLNMEYYLNDENGASENEKIRRVCWLFFAAENKKKYAQTIIKEENLKLESSYPTLSEDIYKKESNKISDYEIKVLIDYALRGGKKEAYRLYKYYQDYKKDETEAAYWLRIGAQNKNLDCQYEYGKYLLCKDDEYSKIRGGFWIRKAIQNGNEEAKKLLKEIEKNEN